MNNVEAIRLSQFSSAIRESTLNRLRLVPEGVENWRPTLEAMSFADHARHLIDTDDWLTRKLETKDISPITGKSHCINIADRKQYLNLLDELRRTGEKRTTFIGQMSDARLSEKIYDA